MTTRDFELDFSHLQDAADISFEQSRAFREYCEWFEAEADNLAAEEAAAEVPTTEEF